MTAAHVCSSHEPSRFNSGEHGQYTLVVKRGMYLTGIGIATQQGLLTLLAHILQTNLRNTRKQSLQPTLRQAMATAKCRHAFDSPRGSSPKRSR